MDALLNLWDKPASQAVFMIAGWEQWADAGAVSSGLPRYLIDHLRARKIGEIKPAGFYIFQVPGTHHFLRPQIKLEDGYRKELKTPTNEFFYVGSGTVSGSEQGKDLVIFLGEEPHLNMDHYADVFFDAVTELGVKRVAVLGGVYGSMPYDKDREVSCVYSLRGMREELTRYAVKFSDYEGGASVGTYLAHRAEERGVELVDFYSMVPAYDFSERSPELQGIRIEHDFRAWYEMMRRLNHMFDLQVDLSDLERQSSELGSAMDAKMAELEREMPQLDVREYLATVNAQFTELSFSPLDEMWERELGDLFNDN
jgi:predicted ATP-grasp superfamily ATP-dependent carboligase